MEEKKKIDKEAFERDVPQQARDMMSFTDVPVIGLVLMNARWDSNGQPLNPNQFYWTGKHPTTGQIAIFPSKRNQEEDFMNDELKRKGQLN
jgi:hypothetical protein